MQIHITNLPDTQGQIIRDFVALLTDPAETANLDTFLAGRSVLRVDPLTRGLCHLPKEDLLDALLPDRTPAFTRQWLTRKT